MSQTAIHEGPAIRAPARTAQDRVAGRVWIVAFLIATATPLMFYVGSAYLNVHRTLMLLMIVPLFFAWAAGKAPGKVLLVDILMVFNVLWVLMALAVNHPPGQILIFWVSQAIETLGPYLLARLVIRDRASFLFFCKAFALVVLALMPFAAIEAFTSRTILVDLFSQVPGTGVLPNVGYGERMGLTRAQVTFEHPILYGVYCAIPLSLAFVALRADPRVSAFGRKIRAVGILAAVFFSVSSGALAAAMIQIGLMVWDRVLRDMKARWKLLAGLFATAYVVIDLLSNRAPLVVLISYVTFSTSTAYNRVLIWRYGTDDVTSNLFFGIGLNDWTRPAWMVSSVDNFWLLWAMRYGLVGFLLLAVPILIILGRAMRRDFSTDPGLADCRKGYVFSVIGVITALGTVAFWGAPYAMLCFLIGSGVWLLTVEPDDGAAPAQPPSGPPAGRYSRFAHSHDATDPAPRRRALQSRRLGRKTR